ncbi:hypothetical protein GCM10007170_25920 [Arthrobacter liuii]|uniref:Secreted protein n=1 Tax=Arthrobacter liuii TaxID=1476996 RepID=A0ABQ2ASZ7_9MICC|nr:hypothetical protein GCM10007170_25920 [Arthrobacter liuii]
MASTTLTLACTASSSLASMLLLVRTTGWCVVIMAILGAGAVVLRTLFTLRLPGHRRMEREMNVKRSFRSRPGRTAAKGVPAGELR